MLKWSVRPRVRVFQYFENSVSDLDAQARSGVTEGGAEVGEGGAKNSLTKNIL